MSHEFINVLISHLDYHTTHEDANLEIIIIIVLIPNNSFSEQTKDFQASHFGELF